MQPWQSLDVATKALLARLDRELTERGRGASPTEKLGGVMKTGAELENVLECLVVEVAAAQGEPAPLVDGKKVSHAGAGALRRELRRRSQRGMAPPPPVARFVAAVVAWDSWSHSFVTHARNPAAHDGQVNEEGARRFMRAMREAVFAFRQQMGWRVP